MDPEIINKTYKSMSIFKLKLKDIIISISAVNHKSTEDSNNEQSYWPRLQLELGNIEMAKYSEKINFNLNLAMLKCDWISCSNRAKLNISDKMDIGTIIALKDIKYQNINNERIDVGMKQVMAHGSYQKIIVVLNLIKELKLQLKNIIVASEMRGEYSISGQSMNLTRRLDSGHRQGSTNANIIKIIIKKEIIINLKINKFYILFCDDRSYNEFPLINIIIQNYKLKINKSKDDEKSNMHNAFKPSVQIFNRHKLAFEYLIEPFNTQVQFKLFKVIY